MAIKVPVVDKIRRKLGKIEAPVVDERSTSTYMVDKIVSVYEEQKDSIHLKHEKLFNVCRAHLPMDASMLYLIVDRCGIIPNLGAHTLSVRELAFRHRKKVLEKAVTYGWIRTKEDTSLVRMHEVEPSIDVNKFFKMNGDRWKEIVDIWCTEGLKKDERLVNSFKATQIPLVGDPTYWQPFNSHSFWLTNTGTGKSFFSEIAGITSSVDLSIAGLFGSNVDDYSKQQIGALEGYGLFPIDEIEQLSKYEYSANVMLSLLSYLEQGKVERRLKIPIRCEGTKSIVFISNPKTDDLLESLSSFLRLLQHDADTKRLGRRIAVLLVGNNFKVVKMKNAKPTLRGLIPRVLHYSVIKWWDTKLQKILKTEMQWITDQDERYKDFRNTIQQKAMTCPNVLVKNFINGLSLSLDRLRMSACRIAILENLEKVAVSGYRSCMRSVDEVREEKFMELVSANLKSIDNLIVEMDKLEPTKDCAQNVKAKFPSLSVRDISLLLNVSHTTIAEWLKD